MVKTSDVIYLVSMSGEILAPLSKQADWELEEVKKSTNRLIVDIPLKDGLSVTTDQELLFRGKRYVISEVKRSRATATLELSADEAQVELADRNIKKFSLKKAQLEVAMKRAVLGSKWEIGTVAFDSKEYYAELENKSSMYCLTFLESQSGGLLVFDSVNRVVSLIKPEEAVPDKTFRYKQNMEDIDKTEVQPQATIIYPYGKEGMSIASVNNDIPYLEDFSWYTDLGVDIKEARLKYSKEYVWEDSRYIFAGNLLNDARKKLATMSHPQINYTIKASGIDAEDLSLNEAVYVVDEELGVKLKAIVTKRRICKDRSRNEIELDYMPNSLTDIFDEEGAGDSSGNTSEIAIFQVKNPSRVSLNTVPNKVLSASVTVYTATSFDVGLSIVVECAGTGIIEGYFMMDGEKLPTQIKQTVSGAGWVTIGLPFIITQIQEGTKYLDFYMTYTGTAYIQPERAEMFVKSTGAYGGMSNERPDQRVVDDIKFSTNYLIRVGDSGKYTFEPLIKRNPVDNVVFSGNDKITVSDSVSIVFGP